MRDKVILGLTLTLVLLGTLAIYAAVDFIRVPAAQAAALERSITDGRNTYALYCVQCHGPQGEGCIGPALNRVAWRTELNGEANPEFDPDSYNFIYNVLDRGRRSNQPGVEMPAWGQENNGALNDEQLRNLTLFIQNGDWDTVIEHSASATNLDQDLPTYEGFDGDLAAVKQVMLEKGCINCHQVGAVGGKVAADLTDVGSRRTADWLRTWIEDPASVPAQERGPNLWLIGPTPSLETPAPDAEPTATAAAFPMNTTFMPKIEMTEEELDLIVDYLANAKTR